PGTARAVLAPKVTGTLALAAALRRADPDFVLLCSSLGAIAGGIGRVDYCAANAFLDGFAHAHAQADGDADGSGGPRILSVDWDAWRDVGMSVTGDVPPAMRALIDQAAA